MKKYICNNSHQIDLCAQYFIWTQLKNSFFNKYFNNKECENYIRAITSLFNKLPATYGDVKHKLPTSKGKIAFSVKMK